jgi:hypothetical protein
MLKKKISYFNHLKNNYYHPVNNSKLLAGLGILTLNLFSKYIKLDLSKSQEALLKSLLSRELLIFVMAFVGTRDLIISFFLTATFIILSGTIFNENSCLCIIPEKYKELHHQIDNNTDGIISDKEILDATKILYKANQLGKF